MFMDGTTTYSCDTLVAGLILQSTPIDWWCLYWIHRDTNPSIYTVPPYACCIEDLSVCQYPKPHSKHQDTPEAHYQPALKPFNIIWRCCKSLLKMFTKTEQHTSLWICKHHYNALGTPTSSSMMFGSPVMMLASLQCSWDTNFIKHDVWVTSNDCL